MKRLPNTLTILRFFLTFLFFSLILKSGLTFKILALGIFLLASCTDFFDGYIAKKHNVISNFGKLMDPIADKFLILTAFFVFTQMHIMALWMFLAIFIREITITSLRLWALKKGVILAAERAGKYKTVSQIICICVILFFLIFRELNLSDMGSSYQILFGLQSMIYVLLLAAVFLTLFSGFLYLWNNRQLVYAA